MRYAPTLVHPNAARISAHFDIDPRNAARRRHISVLEVENGAQKKDAPSEGGVPKHIDTANVALAIPFLYRSTTTRLARVRACTPGAYMAAQRMAGRMNDPAYEACNRTRNVFVSPLLRSK